MSADQLLQQQQQQQQQQLSGQQQQQYFTEFNQLSEVATKTALDLMNKV
jgi:hypothetical protein